ncbi:BTAD domain-containing putative transcriptional regulator [Microbacterium sp. BK668]|uniref:nSTAND1 domain-containing NTPase n=1 Tax=Microbacterium sp. BK668 TaxID=2512118 RepID=UPI0010D7115B|nr:BTAD domain-containing putative transcriptional regulator [Microbacterium sp. BK668]TDN92295.1 DNA-binding SARP family transcriptional activator [Microbacterium sp. BK668]
MEVRVLGALALDDGRIPLARRDRAVLGALVVRPGATVSAGSLAAAVWGDDLPASWSKVIQGCVMRLRRMVAPGRIETTPTGYRLLTEGVDTDAGRFEQLVERGSEQLELGEPERAAHTLSEALALWRGEAFAELLDWQPARNASDRLGELRLSAEELLLDARLRAGDVQAVAAEARARVAEAPLRERRWVVLGLAQYRQGRQADALSTVRNARALLAAELGLDPCAELAALEQAILRQDASLLSDHAFRASSAECPYFGLPPADVDDADRYFGRVTELAEALRIVEDHGVLLVAGASGVGKSSFVRAGIGGRLRASGAEVVIVTPGEHPLDAVRGIHFEGGASVLIVDQCEQAFAAPDPAETREFFETLSRLLFRSTLVIALRADRLGDLAEHAGFAQIIRSRMLVLTPLGADGVRAIIEKPAGQAGLILEPGLAEVLVRDADGRSLPLLSHALRQVWSRREGRVLTVDGYRASGEIDGAVAQTAEELYARLPDTERRLLRDILLRLVDFADGVANGRRVERALVEIDDAHSRIIEELVDARLLTTDEQSVQLSHEALAREWPRLTEWLEGDVEGQRIMRHLAATAVAWDAMGRPDSELYRGSRLLNAQQWQDAASPSLTSLERDFLRTSGEHEKAELAAARSQLSRERRMVRRLTYVSLGAAALAVTAVAASIYAGVQADIAGEAALDITSRRVAELAVDEPELDLALLLAVQAARLHDSPEARASLLEVFARAPRATSVTYTPPMNPVRRDEILGTELVSQRSPDGSRVAIPSPLTSEDASWGTIKLWGTSAPRDADPVTLWLRLRGKDPTTGFAARIAPMFSPDGSRLYAGGTGPIAVFDTATGRQVGEIGGGGLLAVSADGRRLAVGGGAREVRIVDPAGVAAPITVPLPGAPTVAAFSPDGAQLAVHATGRTMLVDVDDAEVIEILHDQRQGVSEMAFPAEGQLVTRAPDGKTITWALGGWEAAFGGSDFRLTGSAFANNGAALQLERPDGGVQVVVADPAVWQERACAVAGRALTPQEWRQHVGDLPYAPACRD